MGVVPVCDAVQRVADNLADVVEVRLLGRSDFVVEHRLPLFLADRLWDGVIRHNPDIQHGVVGEADARLVPVLGLHEIFVDDSLVGGSGLHMAADGGEARAPLPLRFPIDADLRPHSVTPAFGLSSGDGFGSYSTK